MERNSTKSFFCISIMSSFFGAMILGIGKQSEIVCKCTRKRWTVTRRNSQDRPTNCTNHLATEASYKWSTTILTLFTGNGASNGRPIGSWKKKSMTNS